MSPNGIESLHKYLQLLMHSGRVSKYSIRVEASAAILMTLVFIIITCIGLLQHRGLSHPLSSSSELTRSLLETNAESLDILLQQALEKWHPLCGDPSMNLILNRGDGYGTQAERFKSLPWTLTSSSFLSFFSTQTPSGDVKPVCNSINQIVEACAVFPLQQTCLIPWLSPEEITHTLEQYTRVVLFGDSLSRHISDGLLMMYTLDFETGIFPKDGSIRNEVLKTCRCDGQFSEAEICRRFNGPFYHYKLAPDLYFDYYHHPIPNVQEFAGAEQWLMEATHRRCPTLLKPIFALIQGGSHLSTDSSKTITHLIEPAMKQMHQLMQSCSLPVEERRKYFRLAYIGVPVISIGMENRYPHQSRAKALIFNAQMQHYLSMTHPDVVYLDLWNITKDAEDRSSDGFHKLSDVNVIQAATLLNVMRESSKPVA